MRSCEIAQRTRYSGDLGNTPAHMKETILLEEELSGGTTYLDSFRGASKPPTEADLCHGLQWPISVRNQSCIFVSHVFMRACRTLNRSSI
jgi:hypothetical protein